jgi:hypothetical protein
MALHVDSDTTSIGMENKGRNSPLIELNIRGKRSARVRNGTNNSNSVPPRGRPMKRASELATTRKRARIEAFETAKRQRSIVNDTKAPNALSALERLPVELIQQIFLHSLELNLPRSSASLARSLSKESIYTSLILLAFFDDDGKHPVDERLFKPAQYRQLDLAEKVRLQTSILDSRWCTLQRLRRNLAALSHLAIVQAWHEERERELLKDMVRLELPPITPSPALQAVASLPALSDIHAVEHHFLATSSGGFSGDLGEAETSSSYLPRIRTWTSSEDNDGQTYKTVDAARGILNVRYIPRRLLRGSPWTPEKIAFLRLVRQGWRFLQRDFVLKVSSAAVFDGMASAIAERNVEALSVLLELHFAAFQNEASYTNVTASGRVRAAVSFSDPIPLELFHLATKQHEHSTKLISLLLREGIDSIRDDVILTKWALGACRDNNKLGEWLLKHMEGTEDYGLNGSSLFVNGNMTWRRTAGEYPFPEISFTDELNYLKDGAVNFIPQRLDDG